MRKIILFVLSGFLILFASVGSKEFLEVQNLQSFFQRLTGLSVLAIAFAFPLAAGVIDFSGLGFYFLSLILAEYLRDTIWYADQGSDFRLLVLLSIPILFSGLGLLYGLALSRVQKSKGLFLSTGMAILLISLALLFKPSVSPACEAWLCGDLLIGADFVFLSSVAFTLFVSVAAIKYFWPRWTWIWPVSLAWLASLLLVFITHEYQGLPLGAVIALGAIICFYTLTEHTKLGISLLAWGSNEEAARLSGVRAPGVYALAYGALGFFSSLASLMEFRAFEATQALRSLDLGILAWSALIIGGVAIRQQRSTLNALLAGVLLVSCLEALWWAQSWPMSLLFTALGGLVVLSASVKI